MRVWVKPECKQYYPNKFHKTSVLDVGFDLVSCVDVVIEPGQRVVIPTGVHVALDGLRLGDVCAYGRIADRSGLASKRYLHVLAGVVDPGYRGEVKVVIVNLGDKAFEVRKGMRVAQLVIELAWCGEPEFVENYEQLGQTDRGTKGFGSSGV